MHYISDFDLHANPSVMDGYDVFVSLGHDEYWSKTMFDAVYDRIFTQGKHVLFLGANIAYWQVRFSDVNAPTGAPDWGRQYVCWKTMDDPVTWRSNDRLLPTARFRDDARRPETMLMGVGYDGWFETESAGLNGYDIHDNGYSRWAKRWRASGQKTSFAEFFTADVDHPWFAGTGLSTGDSVGQILGYEWDNRDPQEYGNGHARLWDAERSLIPELPADSLQVLFAGEATTTYDKTTQAEAVTFRSDAGAVVFSAATVRWAWGVSKPGYESDAMQRFNRNILESLIDD